MSIRKGNIFIIAALLLFLFVGETYMQPAYAQEQTSSISGKTVNAVVQKLTQKYGPAHSFRIEKGVNQAASLWRIKDGTEAEFEAFCLENFTAGPEKLNASLKRFEDNFEIINGHMNIINRKVNWPISVDTGEILPVEYLFAEYSPMAHLNDDYFKTKIAFFALLNFPYYPLKEKFASGASWDRLKWAQARLADAFTTRVPAEVLQEVDKAYLKADDYINSYNIYMHNIVDENGNRPFPEGVKLISHWGLRDYLKGLYNDKDGLAKQKIIQVIMERIITQEIPQEVINNDKVDWNPVTNKVYKNGVIQKADREEDSRYKNLLAVFKAEKVKDPYCPQNPTLIKRRFNVNREIPEEKCEELLISVLSSPAAKNAGKYLEKRLGRKLQPFDIWYIGFIAGKNYKQEDLDKICLSRYPAPLAYQKDIPNLLKALGFSDEKAAFIGSKIEVDPARGAGHEWPPASRDDNVHLRTRCTKDGLNYQGFNTGTHELGHSTEAVISLYYIDHTLLSGVPNTAFTEAFAFLFQEKSMELLGLSPKDDPEKESLDDLRIFWQTYEISGVALLDMRIWRWMYEHSAASPAEVKEAMISISKDIWNKYYAPVFGVKDCMLLAIYSHMIDSGMYIPDYPLGYIIQAQLEQYFKGKNLAQEMERVCKQGCITPSAWMIGAVGEDISTKPLLDAADKAVKSLNK